MFANEVIWIIGRTTWASPTCSPAPKSTPRFERRNLPAKRISLHRLLPPRHRHCRRLGVLVAANVFGPVFEPRHETDQLLDRFLVSLLTFLGSGQFRL